MHKLRSIWLHTHGGPTKYWAWTKLGKAKIWQEMIRSVHKQAKIRILPNLRLDGGCVMINNYFFYKNHKGDIYNPHVIVIFNQNTRELDPVLGG